jgi:selenoprotein W-related protein
LAAALQQTFGLTAELIKGTGGVFEVRLDGDLVFSKKATGRFPLPDEVEAAISRRLGA